MRGMKRLPPPTTRERDRAGVAARELRERWGHPALMGERIAAHIDLARPRRAVWTVQWTGLPGFSRWNNAFLHELLPGWEYTEAEILAEMVPDLERLAETGERPKAATR